MLLCLSELKACLPVTILKETENGVYGIQKHVVTYGLA